MGATRYEESDTCSTEWKPLAVTSESHAVRVGHSVNASAFTATTRRDFEGYAYLFSSGNRIVKLVPTLGVLSTLIEPLWSSTTFLVM